MPMPLLIKNGRIITATDDYVADIYCDGETITRIGTSIDPWLCAPNTTTIDAAGKYVFPGFIDPHVHMELPFMGTVASEDFFSGTSAGVAVELGGLKDPVKLIVGVSSGGGTPGTFIRRDGEAVSYLVIK